MQHLPDFYKNLSKVAKENNLSLDDIAFIVTSAGHTTSFFSRSFNEKTYFYFIDSFASFFVGKLEIYDNIESLHQRLLTNWKGEFNADITCFTLKEKYNNKLEVSSQVDEVVITGSMQKK